MADYRDTRIYEALVAHLAALGLTPALPIAYEGRPFTRPTSGGYLRANLLRGRTEQATVGSDPQLRAVGVFQVSVFWPENEGTVLPLEIAGQIGAHFKVGTDLTREGVTVTVRGPPWSGSALFEPGWSMIPVSIPYWSHGKLTAA